MRRRATPGAFFGSRGLAALAILTLLPAAAGAITPEEAQLAELKRLRVQVAGEVQLAAFNMLDELVYEWTQAPPFGEPTPVFVADVSVPVGLGTGLEALIENHLAALVLANPTTRVTLSHCPSCTAVITHAGPKGTVVSRGLDNPEALARIGGAGGRHGLYLDFAAEGAWLVLRARITHLTPALPIVWSRTLSASAGAPSLLREPEQIKSADAARKEYLDALNGRGPYSIPVRFTIRNYEAGDSGAAPPPVVWFQTGFEAALTQARKWYASVVLGYAWLPEAYDGFMAQARMYRLLTGDTRSLTGPDLYLFLGGALMSLTGPAIAPFSTNNFDQVLQADSGSLDTRATFGGLHIGLEFRVGNRIGASVFLENMPAYSGSDRIGTFISSNIIDFHSFGAEVSFWF